ncbi:hypothetical protein MTO96_029558 [Rhipicephalus appendiculatus]
MELIRQVISAGRGIAFQAQRKQCKVMPCVAGVPSSSHILRTGAFTTYIYWLSDYRDCQLPMYQLRSYVLAGRLGPAVKDEGGHQGGAAPRLAPLHTAQCVVHGSPQCWRDTTMRSSLGPVHRGIREPSDRRNHSTPGSCSRQR